MVKVSLRRLLPAALLRDPYVQIGILNLANRLPQYASISSRYDYPQADFRGRTVSLAFGSRF